MDGGRVALAGAAASLHDGPRVAGLYLDERPTAVRE